MADIFLSYVRADKIRVKRLVNVLRKAGCQTWWDDDIPPDAPWETTIEGELARAKVVVVCWSKAATASENVRAEARRAKADGRLIQIFLEPCEPPLFFGERQGINLFEDERPDGEPTQRLIGRLNVILETRRLARSAAVDRHRVGEGCWSPVSPPLSRLGQSDGSCRGVALPTAVQRALRLCPSPTCRAIPRKPISRTEWRKNCATRSVACRASK